jgi:hypothetical protein
VWKRNLLFVGLSLVGAASLAGALLQRERIREPENFRPKQWQRSDLGEVVEQVNREFRASWQARGLRSAPRADDLTIARRLSLGLTGTIPSLEEIRALESVPEGERVQWWVARLVEDRRYADYVAERLARAYVGTENGPFLVFRRRRFVSWLSDQLHENEPYDEVVRKLIDSEGIWTSSPPVNFVTVTIDQDEGGQPDPVRLAGRTSRAFLGMRIDCLECHDDNLGTIDLGTADDPRGGTQADFHELAAFYSGTSVSLMGISEEERDYQYKFLYADEEVAVAPEPPFLDELMPSRGNRRGRLARWVTDPRNKPFARATVNRVWALMFGRPLVQPVDDIPLYGEFPPALETLATDFAENGFDLRRLIQIIAATDVCQIDSRADFEVTPAHEKAWAVMPLSRLRPEQVAGALIQSASLKTIDANAHILMRLARFQQENEFVTRYGDMGEDEFEDRGGTITQRLLMMNGELVKAKTEDNAIANAATKIAILAADDPAAVEAAYLCTLTRRPAATELAHFVAKLNGKRGMERTRTLEDVCWTLLNSTEFSWNH